MNDVVPLSAVPANAAALVYPDGTVEVIQFLTATETAEREYTLSGLLRGRMNTTPGAHAVGAWFVLQGGLFLLLLVALASRLARLGAPGPVKRLLEAAGGLVFIALALRLLRERPALA